MISLTTTERESLMRKGLISVTPSEPVPENRIEAPIPLPATRRQKKTHVQMLESKLERLQKAMAGAQANYHRLYMRRRRQQEWLELFDKIKSELIRLKQKSSTEAALRGPGKSEQAEMSYNECINTVQVMLNQFIE